MSIVVTPIPRLIDLAAPAFTLGTANAAGSAETAVSSNSTLLAFDALAVDSITFGQSGAVGSATVSSRRDHAHAMEAAPTTNICVRAFNDADEVIATATSTKITLNSESYDTDTMHATTGANTSRLVATTAGVYVIMGAAHFESHAAGRRAIQIRHSTSGSIIAAQEWDANDNGVTRMLISTEYKMPAASYVDMEVYQTSTTDLNILYDEYNSPVFAMVWVGAG